MDSSLLGLHPIPGVLDTQESAPKRHLDWFSRFCTAYPCYRVLKATLPSLRHINQYVLLLLTHRRQTHRPCYVRYLLQQAADLCTACRQCGLKLLHWLHSFTICYQNLEERGNAPCNTSFSPQTLTSSKYRTFSKTWIQQQHQNCTETHCLWDGRMLEQQRYWPNISETSTALLSVLAFRRSRSKLESRNLVSIVCTVVTSWRRNAASSMLRLNGKYECNSSSSAELTTARILQKCH